MMSRMVFIHLLLLRALSAIAGAATRGTSLPPTARHKLDVLPSLDSLPENAQGVKVSFLATD